MERTIKDLGIFDQGEQGGVRKGGGEEEERGGVGEDQEESKSESQRESGEI